MEESKFIPARPEDKPIFDALKNQGKEDWPTAELEVVRLDINFHVQFKRGKMEKRALDWPWSFPPMMGNSIYGVFAPGQHPYEERAFDHYRCELDVMRVEYVVPGFDFQGEPVSEPRIDVMVREV